MKILEQAYIDLERKSIEEKYFPNLSAIFQNARDTLNKNGETAEATKAQYEIDFLNFNINSNKLSYRRQGTDERGEIIEYPSLERFTEETYKHLVKRQKETKSESLKARYSHILWLSPKKKIEYAQTAINGYLELIKIREKQDFEFPNDNFGLQVLGNIKNAYFLSVSVKYKIEDIKREIIRLVKNYSSESSSANAIKSQLINLMLNQKLIFDKKDFEGIPEICEQIITKLYLTNKHFTIDIITLLIKIRSKFNQETTKEEKRIAEIWEELGEDGKDETNFVSTYFYEKALKIYKKLNETNKIKKLEKRLNESKKNIKFSKYEQELELTELLEENQRNADKITDNEPFAIINYLMTDKKILPTYDRARELSKEAYKNSILKHLATSSILDKNGNIMQYFNDENEYENYELLQSYRIALEIDNFLIHEILFAGIKKGKLNANNFLSFLREYSWLGQEFEIAINGEKPLSYCWLGLIAPALYEYFEKIDLFLNNQTNYPNFILCIDSLSLKIEGMLRDLCRFKNITTFKQKTDKKGRITSQEKDIHNLLYEPEIVNLIDKDDLLFFKFLLVEKSGYNLRHRVAHSLMTFNEYTLSLMNLLIIAILKFGKYKLVAENKD